MLSPGILDAGEVLGFGDGGVYNFASVAVDAAGEHGVGQNAGMGIQYGNLGVVLKTRGDLAGAREHWVKARDLIQQIGMPHMVEQVQGWLDELPDKEE